MSREYTDGVAKCHAFVLIQAALTIPPSELAKAKPSANHWRVQAAEIAGIRAILVHTISERAKRFYLRWGFILSPVEPMTLMITVAEERKAIVEKSE
jgi:hypothetical protein